MAYFQGTTSYSTTGIKTITCVDLATGVSFQPTWYKIKVGATRSYIQHSESSYGFNAAVWCKSECGIPGTNFQQVTTASLASAGGGKVINLKNLVSGSISQVVDVDHDSFVTTGFRINVLLGSSSYPWLIEAGA